MHSGSPGLGRDHSRPPRRQVRCDRGFDGDHRGTQEKRSPSPTCTTTPRPNSPAGRARGSPSTPRAWPAGQSGCNAPPFTTTSSRKSSARAPASCATAHRKRLSGMPPPPSWTLLLAGSVVLSSGFLATGMGKRWEFAGPDFTDAKYFGVGAGNRGAQARRGIAREAECTALRAILRNGVYKAIKRQVFRLQRLWRAAAPIAPPPATPTDSSNRADCRLYNGGSHEK